MPQPRSAPDTRKPYAGSLRSLVIAIDVGTTFSGVSYAILEPTLIPKIHGVTRFPGQEHVAGNTKIPSILYYDKHGKVMAAGAEADQSAIEAQAEDEGWIKAELFKLRLRPRTMKLNMNGMRLGPLPKRKTAVHVFGDFLAYLFRCTRNFICDTHANGAALWSQVENDLQFVLSHPNGWEGAQQSKMRRAAIYGGLIPDTNEGKARIRFVTEGEASLHACVLNGLAADVLTNPSKHGFLIADAGGGTLDISAYAIKGTSPLVIEEIAPPDCLFAGSVFVSRRAREFLEEKLKKSKYGTPDSLDHITRKFDETTKRLFRDRKDLQFIPFGSPLDKDPAVGIRSGQLKLTGQEVAELFEPSVNAAFKAIKSQVESSQGMIRSVFLVGGYAASPWLFQQLQERLAPYRVSVSRPDTQTSKAVADGAIGFYCDHHVSARMSKFMYGVEFLREMDPRDPDHVARKERLCELPSGPKLLPDAFDCILARSVRVKESTVFTRKYCTELTSLSMLSVFEVEIWCYRGGNEVPKWINRQADDFSTLCVVRADLSPLASSAEPKAGKSGKTYWTIVFSVEIQFGLTEFKARIKWVDGGVTKYGPASIIYNERGHRADEDEPDVYPEDDYNTKTNLNTPISASSAGTTTPRSTSSRNRDREREKDRVRGLEVGVGSSRSKRDSTHSHATTHSTTHSTTSSRRPSITASIAPSHSGGGYGNGVIPGVARVDHRSESHSHSSRDSGSGSGRDKEKERERKQDRDREREWERERERESYSVSATTSKAPSRSHSQRSATTIMTTTTTNRIGETLNSIWGQTPSGPPSIAPSTHTIQGGGGSRSRIQSQIGSPIMESPSQQQQHVQAPIQAQTQAQTQIPSSISRASSLYSNTPYPPQQQSQTQHQQSVPPTPLTRSSTIHSHNSTTTTTTTTTSNKEPYVETISTTIENPKSLSPWDPVPPQTPTQPSVSRALSTDSRKSSKSNRTGSGGGGDGGDDDDAVPLWDSQQQQQQPVQETTVLLSNINNPPIDIDLSPTRSRAGSISASGWGGDMSIGGGGVGVGGGPGWGTPRTININTTTAPPTEWDTTSQISKTPTRIGRSRKGSMATSIAPTIPSVKEHDEFGVGEDQWGTTGHDNNVTDGWGFDDNTREHEHEQTQPPPIDQSRSLPPIETTKSSGTKTPKTTGSKTPKTPATEFSVETPVEESVGGDKKKKKKKKDAAAAATAAAAAQQEEAERVRLAKEAEEAEKARLADAEEVERARIAVKEAEEARIVAEEAKKARLAAEEAEEEEAEKARVAAEEAESVRKEEEKAAAAEAEAERKKKEEEQKAREVADKQKEEKKAATEKNSKKKSKGLKAEQKEKEKLEAKQQAQTEQERLAKEAQEKEAEEAKRDEQERLAKEAQTKAAEEAKQHEEQERLAKEAKANEEKEAQEAKEREQQKKEKEVADAAAVAIVAAEVSPVSKVKNGKKSRKGSMVDLGLSNDNAEEERKKEEVRKMKEEEERLAQEEQAKAEQEAKEKAEKEAKQKADEEAKKAEQEAKEKEKEKQRLEQEAKENEREREAKEEKEKADREKAEEEARAKAERERAEKEKRTSQIGSGGSPSLFDAWGGGNSGSQNGGSQNGGSNTGGGSSWRLSWGKPKSAVSSIASGLGKLLGDSENKLEGSPGTNTPTKKNIFEGLKYGAPATPPKPSNNTNALFDDLELPILNQPTNQVDTHPPVPSKTASKVPSKVPSRAPSPTPALIPVPIPAPPTPTVESVSSPTPAAEPVQPTPTTKHPPTTAEPPDDPTEAVDETDPRASETVADVNTANAEDEWEIPVKTKKKKGKNTPAGDSAPSTPIDLQDDNSKQTGGKKKKGKRK